MFLIVLAAFWGMMLVARLVDHNGPNWYQSAGLAAAFSLVVSVWAYLSVKPELVLDAERHESALRTNEAHVIRVQSSQMVEFEEHEDEGACYAFQLENRQILFISGQEFHSSAKFPNTDFSLAEIAAADGTIVQCFLEKSGKRLRPQRKISSKQKALLRIPDHMQMIEGELGQIEQILASS